MVFFILSPFCMQNWCTFTHSHTFVLTQTPAFKREDLWTLNVNPSLKESWRAHRRARQEVVTDRPCKYSICRDTKIHPHWDRIFRHLHTCRKTSSSRCTYHAHRLTRIQACANTRCHPDCLFDHSIASLLSFMGYPSRLLIDILLGRFVVHPCRKKAITLPLVPFSWGSKVSACVFVCLDCN